METTPAPEVKNQTMKIVLNRQQVFMVGGVLGLIVGLLGLLFFGK